MHRRSSVFAGLSGKCTVKTDLCNYMNRVALKTFSYFDTGKEPSGAEPERFYHGFVLGL